jgi:hypothetical protein
MMTSKLLPLAPGQHRGHGWKRYDHYRFAAGDAQVPLLFAELSLSLAFYPLAFASRPGGGLQLVALQGLYDGENLYLDAASGRWQVDYIPSHYRGYPFGLREVVTGDTRSLVLCFDHASGLYREAPNLGLGEELFFDDDGKPRPLLQQLMTFLQVTASNRELTNRAVDALDTAGLLEPWELTLKNPIPGRALQQGLYRVSETKLNALDGQTLESLRNANALTVAYAHIFSIPRLGVLRQLCDRRTTPPTELNPQAILESLFGGGQDDTLQFS